MPASTTFRDVLDIVLRSPHNAFFVVDKNQQLMGAVSLSRLRMSVLQRPELQETVTAGDLITSDLPAVTGDETLDVAAQIMSAKGVDEIPVVDRSDPNRLFGSLSEQDVIKAYNREMSRRDLAGTVASLTGALDKVHEVNIGKTLKGMDVRVRHGIEVVFIRTHGEGRGPQIIVPSSDYLICEGDTLVVAGQKEKVHALEEL
jgi:CBS domain-containing protein